MNFAIFSSNIASELEGYSIRLVVTTAPYIKNDEQMTPRPKSTRVCTYGQQVSSYVDYVLVCTSTHYFIS
jgi:hypothetical protein